MAVIFASTACNMWCPNCGKVLHVTCYRHPDVEPGFHTTCMNRWGEPAPPRLEEYPGFQFQVLGKASMDEREVRG